MRLDLSRDRKGVVYAPPLPYGRGSDLAAQGLHHFLEEQPNLRRDSAGFGRQAMNCCPRCHVPLLAEENGDIVTERCDRCGGRWMTPDDLRALLDLIRLPVEGAAVRTGIDLTDVQEDAACPRCSVPMEPFNYAGDSGVILDRCRICGGLWLDKGNLERVLAVVSASEHNLDHDIKRFSADLHEAEVRQDALEQRDGSPRSDPLAAVLASRIADSDPRP